jgi:hypothetical protein
MDAALALLITIVEVDWRFRTSSALVPSVTVAEGVAAAVTIVALLVVLAAKRPVTAGLLRRTFASAPAPVLYMAWLPCVAAAGLALGSAEGFHALKDSMPALVLLALCLLLPATSARLDRAELALSTVGCLVSLMALSQASFGWPYPIRPGGAVLSKEGWDALADIRNPAVGPFAHPNALAFFLVPVGILAVGRAFDALRERRAWRVGMIHMSCGALSIIAVFLAGAKIGAGALVVGTMIRGIVEAARIRCTPARAVAALALLIVSLGAIVTVALTVPMSNRWSLSPGTLLERWLLNVSAVNFLGSNPTVLILGGGLSSFVDTSARGFQVHNEFLSQVMRFGLLSGLLFLGMVGAAFRGLDERSWSNALSLCGLVLVLAVEPGGGAQQQGAIASILGLCVLRQRATMARPW